MAGSSGLCRTGAQGTALLPLDAGGRSMFDRRMNDTTGTELAFDIAGRVVQHRKLHCWPLGRLPPTKPRSTQ